MHKLDHKRARYGRFVGAIFLGAMAMLLVAAPASGQTKKAPPVSGKTKKAPPAKRASGPKKAVKPPKRAAAATKAAAPTWKQRNAAKKAYKAGVAAMKKKEFVAAAGHFVDSFKSVNSPNSKFMLVRALAAQGKVVAAYRAVVLTVSLAEAAAKKNPRKYKPTLEAAKAEQAKLRQKVAVVRIQPENADAGAKVFVAGQPLAADRWGKEFVVLPGPTEILLRTANGDTKKLVTAAAGADMTITVPAKVATPKTAGKAATESKSGGFVYRGPDRRKMAYIAGGVGVAGMALFGVLGFLSNSQLKRLENSCQGTVCSQDLESVRDRGAAMQVGANVSLGIGLAALAVGGGLFAWDMIDNKKDKADAAVQKLRLFAGPGTLALTGSF